MSTRSPTCSPGSIRFRKKPSESVCDPARLANVAVAVAVVVVVVVGVVVGVVVAVYVAVAVGVVVVVVVAVAMTPETPDSLPTEPKVYLENGVFHVSECPRLKERFFAMSQQRAMRDWPVGRWHSCVTGR